ncbi:MAG TPA: Ppx/GppA phosphatase family protein [Chthonomonadaceae bacterium]|nr:Ppx/GppA phosphatase family protein [Chthonomonadaceae bacterium]
MAGPEPQSNVFAAIDIGTNSIRLAVVRNEDGDKTNTLAIQREVVRLGEGEFETDEMTDDAMKRGALVCTRFAEAARGFGASEIIAFATSAVREAENREEFIDRVRNEAGIEVRVISGMEEARLIWLGVSSGIDLRGRTGMLIDIGGGSTEVIVGTEAGYSVLESMKLGAIRLSNRFFADAGPVSSSDFLKVQYYVQGAASNVIRRVRSAGFDLAIGSAGTINALAAIIARRGGDIAFDQGNPSFRLADLKDTVHALCRMPLEERRRVPGMDANRADIILGGAAIIQTLMEHLSVDRLVASERGLREGILLDHVLRGDEARQHFEQNSVRRRSILQLARTCSYEAEHAQQIVRLALKLFDETARLKLHNYGKAERELLEYAAITHDIGAFLSHSNHHRHAYYLIRNYDLLGFNDSEIEIIANVALYHHKGTPRKHHPNLANMDRDSRRVVETLSALLRIAEGLDRSHLGLVQDIALHRGKKPGRLLLTLGSESDCQLEVWGAQNNREPFERIFGAPLLVQVQRRQAAST